MKEKKEAAIRVVGKRRTQAMDESEICRDGRRNHSVLLGYYRVTDARDFLNGKGLDEDLIEEFGRRFELPVAIEKHNDLTRHAPVVHRGALDDQAPGDAS